MIYHFASLADWEQAKRDGAYTVSTRGRTLAEVGFIHAVTAEQATAVANMVYQGERVLVVLVIDPDGVGPEIRWDAVPGWDTPFPHICGALNVDAVVDIRQIQADANGRFASVA